MDNDHNENTSDSNNNSSNENNSTTEESSSIEEDIDITDPPKVYAKNHKLHEHSFSTTERSVQSVNFPITSFIDDKLFWDENQKPNIQVILDHIRKEGKLSKSQIKWIIENATETFSQEDNIVIVPSPVVVCGDIHGQFYDLLKLLELGGDPSTTRYLFLGDYVDRGNFSIECIILLYTYKILYPETFFMIRGNHECRHLTDYFTFKEECKYKYDEETYDLCMDSFDTLPLAAIMNKQFLCIHGGLSPELDTLEDINNINRFREPPPSGIMCDLLWSDPMEDFSPDVDENFKDNTVRGCSYWYGYNAVCKFIEENGLLSIIRAHEVQDPGYRMHRKNEKTGFPSLITLFSAPKYCGQYDNKGAIMKYENNIINIRQFNHTEHPYYLPGFVNVFTWSLPFLADKIGEILSVISRLVDDAEADEVEKINAEEKKHRVDIIRSKLRTVSRMLSMYKGYIKLKNTLSLNVSDNNNNNTSPTPNESRPPNIINYQINNMRKIRRTQSMDLTVLLKDGILPQKENPTIGIIEEI